LGAFPLQWTAPDSTNSKPVIDSLASVFEVGICFSPTNPGCSAQVLRKCGPGSTEIWSEEVSPDAQWALASDSGSHAYVGGDNGMLAQFDSSGTLVWSNNFATPCQRMVVDVSGNRFLSFTDGSVARLQGDLALAIALSASNVVLTWANSGCTLQTRNDFTAGNWVDATNPVVNVNGTFQVMVSATDAAAFYRLRQ
ncbi:MAG: hypothetical protein ACREIC_25665, partial [Limisphaerales bacterium]